jgi:hypothetical protein
MRIIPPLDAVVSPVTSSRQRSDRFDCRYCLKPKIQKRSNMLPHIRTERHKGMKRLHQACRGASSGNCTSQQQGAKSQRRKASGFLYTPSSQMTD